MPQVKNSNYKVLRELYINLDAIDKKLIKFNSNKISTNPQIILNARKHSQPSPCIIYKNKKTKKRVENIITNFNASEL